MSARADLAAAQAALLHAVLANGPVPPGFDADAVRVEADALLAKRRRIVAQLVPDLAGELDGDYRPLFDEYARTHPRHTGTRFRDDAEAFAAWVAQRRAPAKTRWWRRSRDPGA